MNQQITIRKVHSLHLQAKKNLKLCLQSAKIAGDLLRGLKEGLDSKQLWQEFCVQHFSSIGLSTLASYMRVSRHWDKVKDASSISEALTAIAISPTRKGYRARRFGYNALYRIFRASIKEWDKEERETLCRYPHLLSDSLTVLRQRIVRSKLNMAA